MEGKLKKDNSINQYLNRFQLISDKTLSGSVIISLKYGLRVFVIMLLSLGLFEYLQCLVHGKSIKIIDTVDLAISSLGFLLMFAGKLLEKLYGKG
jgi:hypothetical protein